MGDVICFFLKMIGGKGINLIGCGKNFNKGITVRHITQQKHLHGR